MDSDTAVAVTPGAALASVAGGLSPARPAERPVPETDRGGELRAPAWPDEVADPQGRRLQFEVDEGTGRIVVRVTDPSTGEVLRSVPAEEMLRSAERISKGEAYGLLVDEKR